MHKALFVPLTLLAALVAVPGCGERPTGTGAGANEGYSPDLKLTPARIRPPAIGSIGPDSESGALVVRDEVLLSLSPSKSVADLERELAVAGIRAKVVGDVIDFRVVQLEVTGGASKALRRRIADLDSVGGAMPNSILRPTRDLDDTMLTDADEVNDWGLRIINAPSAWDFTMGEGSTVAVLDSGVDPAHPDVRENLAATWSYRTRSAQQSFERFRTRDGEDQEGLHGTHVAGTIAARGGNAEGTAGVAPAARLLSQQVLYRNCLDQNCTAEAITCSEGELLAALHRAMADGAQVMNLSLGPSFSDDTLVALRDPARRDQTIAEIVASRDQTARVYGDALAEAARRGVVVVVSAGNDGVPADLSPLPSVQWTISVGAIDRQGQVADFGRGRGSNHEDGQGDRSVDICAPGQEIWSLELEGTYIPLQGTSMAAPHVAGAVALLKAVRPSASFEEIRDVLVSTAQRVSTSKDIGPRLDVAAAVREMLSRRDNQRPTPPQQPTPPPGQPVVPPGIAWERQPRVIGEILDGGFTRAGWLFDLVRFLIDAFLRTAVPIDGGRFDEFGRVVDFPRRVAIGPPPDLGGRDRFRYVWDRRERLRSRERGSIEEDLLRRVDDVIRAGPPASPPRATPPPAVRRTPAPQPVVPPTPSPVRETPPPAPRPPAPPLTLLPTPPAMSEPLPRDIDEELLDGPARPPTTPVAPPPPPPAEPPTPPHAKAPPSPPAPTEPVPPVAPPPPPPAAPSLAGSWVVHSDLIGGATYGLAERFVREGLDWNLELTQSGSQGAGQYEDLDPRTSGSIGDVQIDAGGLLRFRKTYTGFIVDYAGTWNAAAHEVRGTWRQDTPAIHGTFVMRRGKIADLSGTWDVHSMERAKGDDRTLESGGIGSGLSWVFELKHPGSSVTGTWSDLGQHPATGSIEAGRMTTEGAITFRKRYRPDYAVDYSGKLDQKTEEIRGTWNVPGRFEGTFVMRRHGAKPAPPPTAPPAAPPAGAPEAERLRDLLAGPEVVGSARDGDWKRVDETHPTHVIVFHGESAAEVARARGYADVVRSLGVKAILAPRKQNPTRAARFGVARLPEILLYDGGVLRKRTDGVDTPDPAGLRAWLGNRDD